MFSNMTCHDTFGTYKVPLKKRGSTMHTLLRTTALTSLLLGTAFAANAADLPPAPRAPVPYMPVAVPVFSWTGFYIGGNIGGGWSRGNVVDSRFGVNFDNGNQASFLGGGQVGGNYQIGSFVIGAEAVFDWFANNNNSGNGTTIPAGPVLPTGAVLRASANDRWETTLAARFGYAWDHALFYGKAGGGWVGADNFAVTNVGTGASLAVTNGNSNVGWLLGTGFEYAFTQNWTAKVEYDYLALNNASHNVTLPSGAVDTFTNGGRNVQTLTVGVNYLFGWNY
jgi:outer membrane immunogenic protein